MKEEANSVLISIYNDHGLLAAIAAALFLALLVRYLAGYLAKPLTMRFLESRKMKPRKSDWIYATAVVAAGLFIAALGHPHLGETPGKLLFGAGVMVGLVGLAIIEALGALGSSRGNLKEE